MPLTSYLETETNVTLDILLGKQITSEIFYNPIEYSSYFTYQKNVILTFLLTRLDVITLE